MVSNPGPQYHDPTRQHRIELDNARQAIRNTANHIPFPFQVNYDPSGVGTPPFVPMFSVQNSGWLDSSGNQIPVTTMRDAQGNIIFAQAPAATSGSVASSWFWNFQDIHHNQVLATDGLSGYGLAYPYIPVPLYPIWNGLPSTVTGGGAPSWNTYSQVLASSVTSETALWGGSIGFVSHPAISIRGYWGDAVVGGTVTTTYRLYLSGTLIGSWTQASGAFVYAQHTFDIHTFVGRLDQDLSLTIQAAVSSTDTLAIQPFSCWIRQTPAVFG